MNMKHNTKHTFLKGGYVSYLYKCQIQLSYQSFDFMIYFSHILFDYNWIEVMHLSLHKLAEPIIFKFIRRNIQMITSHTQVG